MVANIIKKYDWGFSIITFHGFKYVPNSNYKQQIHTAGTTVIKAKGTTPLHVHLTDAGQCQALTRGIHALVLSADEAAKMTSEEIIAKVQSQPELKINEISTCCEGQAQILYNSADVIAQINFTRYFSDTK